MSAEAGAPPPPPPSNPNRNKRKIDGYDVEGNSDEEPSLTLDVVGQYPCDVCMEKFQNTGQLNCVYGVGRKTKCNNCTKLRGKCDRQKGLWAKNATLRSGFKELLDLHSRGLSNAVPYKAARKTATETTARVAGKPTKRFSDMVESFRPLYEEAQQRFMRDALNQSFPAILPGDNNSSQALGLASQNLGPAAFGASTGRGNSTGAMMQAIGQHSVALFSQLNQQAENRHQQMMAVLTQNNQNNGSQNSSQQPNNNYYNGGRNNQPRSSSHGYNTGGQGFNNGPNGGNYGYNNDDQNYNSSYHCGGYSSNNSGHGYNNGPNNGSQHYNGSLYDGSGGGSSNSNNNSVNFGHGDHNGNNGDHNGGNGGPSTNDINLGNTSRPRRLRRQ